MCARDLFIAAMFAPWGPEKPRNRSAVKRAGGRNRCGHIRPQADALSSTLRIRDLRAKWASGWCPCPEAAGSSEVVWPTTPRTVPSVRRAGFRPRRCSIAFIAAASAWSRPVPAMTPVSLWWASFPSKIHQRHTIPPGGGIFGAGSGSLCVTIPCAHYVPAARQLPAAEASPGSPSFVYIS